MDPSSREPAEELRLHLLVLRCQAGDEQAFRRLLERFESRTLGYLRGLIGDAAEDVHQEVWLSVYRGLGDLANPRAFRTWLFRTVRHRAIDYLRARKRERELFPGVDPAVIETAGAEDPAPPEPMLDTVLMRLAAIHREVLLLRYRDGLRYEEIAQVAGCSLGTVRSRLFHARRRLRDLLEP